MQTFTAHLVGYLDFVTIDDKGRKAAGAHERWPRAGGPRQILKG